MIDLYYWPTSNGRKITIMLHEVELPYTIIPVNFKIGEQYAPEYLAINPNNKIPAIVDRDPVGGGAPLTIFESVAILIYLAEKSGRLMPADARGRTEVITWALFQAASIGPMFGQMAYFHDYAEPKMPAALDRYENEVRRLYKVLERRLGEAAYLAGDYHRRHRGVAVDPAGAAGAALRGLSEPDALVRRNRGAPGGANRQCGAARSAEGRRADAGRVRAPVALRTAVLA
jgi:glutathione S-transferase